MKNIYLIGVALLLTFSMQTITHADTLPDGCTITTAYSSTTGQLCVIPQSCQPGDLYNSQTGAPCSGNTYLPGCFAGALFSVTTGQNCSGTIISNQSHSMNTQTNKTTSQATSQSAALPVITKSLPNNLGQLYVIKTNVPTTVTIQYVDDTQMLNAQGPLFTGIPTATYAGGRRGANELLIAYLADPANILTYTDSGLTTDHEISYSALNLVPNHFYDTKVTVTDAQGNTANYSYQNDVGFPGTNGDPSGILNNWSISSLSTNKN